MSEAEWEIKKHVAGEKRLRIDPRYEDEASIIITKLSVSEVTTIIREFRGSYPFIDARQTIYSGEVRICCAEGWEWQIIQRLIRRDIGSPSARLSFMLDEATKQ